MTFALLFAILMVLWALTAFGGSTLNTRWPYAGNLLLFVLFLLLGWRVFGPLLKP